MKPGKTITLIIGLQPLIKTWLLRMGQMLAIWVSVEQWAISMGNGWMFMGQERKEAIQKSVIPTNTQLDLVRKVMQSEYLIT